MSSSFYILEKCSVFLYFYGIKVLKYFYSQQIIGPLYFKNQRSKEKFEKS